MLSTESDRNEILAPIPYKIYIVLESGYSYIYINSWIKLGPPEPLEFLKSPKKMGNWIDNTPIWRVGFDIGISEGNVSVDIPLCISGQGVKIINCECFSTIDSLNNTYNRKSEISFNDGIMNISYINDTGDSSIYGWVDFVTTVDNVYNLLRPEEYFASYKQQDGTYKLTGNELNSIIIPVFEYINMDNIRFTVSVKASEGQDIDIAYGDIDGIKVSSFTADSEFEELTLSNVGYPVTGTGYFKIRCHSAKDNYVILKDMRIEVI